MRRLAEIETGVAATTVRQVKLRVSRIIVAFEKSLKALDKFTGRQLAEAFDADGKFDATTKAGKAIFAAVTAQQELSDLLPRQALAMHGTADALATVCEEVFVVSPTFRFGCPMRRRSQA